MLEGLEYINPRSSDQEINLVPRKKISIQDQEDITNFNICCNVVGNDLIVFDYNEKRDLGHEIMRIQERDQIVLTDLVTYQKIKGSSTTQNTNTEYYKHYKRFCSYTIDQKHARPVDPKEIVDESMAYIETQTYRTEKADKIRSDIMEYITRNQ